jgi:hypothetical protein
MKRKLVTTLVVAAIDLYVASLAQAACPIDGATPFRSGPLNPINGFTESVTDSNGVALQLCTDPTFCFISPVVPGNAFSAQIGTGIETFFWSAGAKLSSPTGLKLALTMATEAAFLSAEPVNGQQIEFARLRVAMTAPVPGVYTLVHPFGTETFTVDALSGGRDVFLTFDRSFPPNASVQGRVGPWLKWDPAVAPPAPTKVRPDGTTQQFLGDGSPLGPTHSVVGSPCGTNFVTLSVLPLTGSPAINLDGSGHNFITTNQFNVAGQVFDGRVQTHLSADRLTYSRPATALGQIDVFATSTNTASITVADGPAIPLGTSRIPTPVILGSDKLSDFSVSDILTIGPNTTDMPPLLSLTASDLTAVPPSDPTTLLAPLVDFVNISQADYNKTTGVLTVVANSGDLRLPPTLTIREYSVAAGTPITTVAPPATVTVVSSHGGSDTAKVRAFTPTPPLAPSTLVGIAGSPTSITLTWADNSNNETSFNVVRNGVVVATLAANATTFVDTGLTAATAYTYQVFAVNAIGQTGSNIVTVSTQSIIPPLAPTLATALANPANTVTLNWVDNSADETGFQVLRSTAAAGPFALVASAAANATSVADTTALPGTTYFYQVVSVRGTLASTAATATLTTPALPSASTAVTAVAAASGTQVTVNWVDANINETGFQVMRSTAGGAFAAVGGVLPADSVTFVDTTALPLTTYTYRVDVSNWAGTTASAASAALTTPAATPVLAPTGAAAVANPANTVTVSWTDNSADETGFQVLRSTSATGVFTVVATPAANATSAADTTAAPATTYFYRVVAVRGTALSTAATTSLTTPALPTASTGVTAVAAATGTQVTVNWTDVNTNETGFQVFRRIGATGAFTLISATLPPDTVSFIDTTVGPATTYTYRVNVINWAGLATSAASPAVTTPTGATVTLLAPTGLIATAAASPVLTWTDTSTGETTYRVRRSLVTVGATGAVTVGAPTTLTSTLAANTTTFTDNTAAGNATYNYEVAARNGTTVGPVATVFTVATLGGLPTVARPTLTRALVGTAARVTVNWTAPGPTNSIGGYEVQRCTGTACTTFAKLTGTAVNTTGTVDGRATVSFVDATVARATSYVYQLRAVGGAGSGLAGAFSATAAVTTQ